MKKYEMTDETITYDNRTLHRIKALIDFSDVKAGDLGGYIEKEENLSHEGDCWVYNKAKVYGDAKVFDSAVVNGFAIVYEKARIFGSAVIANCSMIYGKARVYGDCRIDGFSDISGPAVIKVGVVLSDILVNGGTITNDF